MLITLAIIIVIVIVIFLLLFNGFEASSFTKSDKKEIERAGKIGEDIVSEELSKLANEYGGYLFDKFIFRDKYNENYSTDIDHILITRGGIFVIETKNNSGTILGKDDEQEWVCLKSGIQKNKTLRNPINQNQVHIKSLKRMFNVTPPKMISMIIFVSADISNVSSNEVYNLKGAIEMIKKLTIESKYSKEFVDKNYKQILYIKNNYSITSEKHLENIKRNHKH